MRLVTNLLVALGVSIAILGFGSDILLPGTSPGVDFHQLLVIAAGLALLLAAARLRRVRHDNQHKPGTAKRLAAALIVALATLTALEIALSVWGMAIYYPYDRVDHEFSAMPWWVCGDAGCHYEYDSVRRACLSGELEGRVCTINRQGFADSADFVLPDDYAERTRILLLGDSFTWGMSADLGASFAETLSAALPEGIIWNTGIPGTGTNQARLVFDVYAPDLRPQLTVLSFYSNDFDDNLLPIDSWINTINWKGEALNLRKYAIDEAENVIAFDLRDLAYIHAYKRHPPRGALEAGLGATRLGTLLLRLRDQLKAAKPAEEQLSRRRQATKEHLLGLKLSVAESGSKFLVVLVPESADIMSAGPRYQMAVALMQELAIPYVNPVRILDPVADYAEPPDSHWNNAGHRRIGRLLSDCVRRFQASGSLAVCENVIMPSVNANR